MNIIYIACEPNIANLFLPIAMALKKKCPTAVNRMIDPAGILYESLESPESPVELFVRHGFKGGIISQNDYPELQSLNYKYKAYLFYFKLFESIKPSVIIVPHEMGYAFYAVQAAKLKGIPSYHVQHGIWGPDKYEGYSATKKENNPGMCESKLFLTKIHEFMKIPPYLIKQTLRQVRSRVYAKPEQSEEFLPSELAGLEEKLIDPPSLQYPLNADRMAIYGHYYQRQLQKERPEFGSDSIDVVGFIRGDNFFNSPVESKEAIYRRYGLDIDSELAIYFYSPFQEFPSSYDLQCHPDEALLDILKTLKKLSKKNISMLILLHPGIRYAHYKKALTSLVAREGYKGVHINKTHNDNFSLCRNAAIVFGVKSGALYEAMLASVPIVVQAYVLSKVYDPQHIEGGAVVPVFSRKHLYKQVERALFDKAFLGRLFENQKAVCEDLLSPLDGKCGERVSSAIIKLIGERETI